MSHRAIERLRRERQGEILPIVGDDSDEDDSSEDDAPAKKKSNVFAAAMFDSDSDEDSDEDSEEESDDESDGEESDVGVRKDKANDSQKEEQTPDVEDLDAILKEYTLHDAEQEDVTTTSDDDLAVMQYSIITSTMETRDLDIEFVRRSLFGGADVGESGSSSRRNHRNSNLFGNPSDNWPRPPHYVGGGIGFQAYSDSKESQRLPWPYCDMKEGDPRCPPLKHWFQFIYSDSYQRDFRDMQMIQNTGDANAMLLFIAHHPFVVESLLQISIVMYQMNQGREGLSFLKRALWIFECATPNTFLKAKTRCALMDYQKDGNKTFFSTLFRLIRVSYVGGLTRNAFAVSQFLLSLDPLRDPINVLLSIDHCALMCNTETSNRWLVDFVESKKVHVAFRDGESQEEFQCQILDLPNWGFSYALALFNLDVATPSDDTKEQANSALQTAICQFPSIVGRLLSESEVDTSSRSIRTDWPTALKYLDEVDSDFQKRNYEAYTSDTVMRARISQAYDTIVRIFVQQNSKLWSSSNVLTWVYNNLMALREEAKGLDKVMPLSPAIIRYVDADPSNYEDKFQTMPADANPFDPNVIALALNVDPNRRRLVQRNQRQHAGANFMDEHGNAFA
mmetsp:Transcript_15873/g.39843  ORF Transcript_15873/g.39843 Transcript_15873/m.39843 type:complete len:621 (-) Transcript_15873:251-2113(-)